MFLNINLSELLNFAWLKKKCIAYISRINLKTVYMTFIKISGILVKNFYKNLFILEIRMK